MGKKVCSKCKEEKELTEFYKHKKSPCKVCRLLYNKEYRQNNKEKRREYRKEYDEKNKEKIKEYYQNNKERLNKRIKEYRQNNIVKERLKEYRQNNKDRIMEYKNRYARLRRKSEPLFKITTNIRNLISRSIKRNGYNKKSKTYKILGCSFEEFKLHIESQWEEWMNWDNYGKCNGEEKYGWDIDHIIPVSSGKCEESNIRLNHYSNMRPLCSYVNRYVKRDKTDYESIY